MGKMLTDSQHRHKKLVSGGTECWETWKREDHSGSPASLSNSRFSEMPCFKTKERVTEGLCLPYFAYDHLHLHQKGGRRKEKRQAIEQTNSRLGREFQIDPPG